MIGLRGWRTPLRLAWRDAMRSKGRSVLVVVMIALPVMGVTAADVVLQTQDVSGAEALERRLGTADARISFDTGAGRVYQRFDPNDGSGWEQSGRELSKEPSVDTIGDALGRSVRGIELRVDSVRFYSDEGVGQAEATELDLTDPLARGMFELTGGELPQDSSQVVVNSALAERGPDVGDQLEIVDGPTLDIVGIVESTSSRGFPIAVTKLGGFDLPVRDGHGTYLVKATPVSWPEVRKLNALGATVLSRAVLENPPPESALPPQISRFDRVDEAVVAVGGLIVVMALLEVVLLAGPAFAVGARRQSHSLALIAASGGTARQGRRVVIASGLVLGGLAAAVGVLLGIGVAAAALPVVRRFDGTVFGPFDVPWLHLVGIALLALVSAFLAAIVPAWLASRQDVVAVLAGRRGDPPTSTRSPVLGLLLVALGVTGSAYGASEGPGGEIYIATSAIPAVLGMILLVPLVLSLLARLVRWSPMAVRFAARDAARHRTRTVPAVAAVAATVAGVVALGIGSTSDELENQATYKPALPMGEATLTVWSSDVDWDELASLVRRELPRAEVTQVRGVPEELGKQAGYLSLEFQVPGKSGTALLPGYGSLHGSTVLVSDHEMPAGLLGVDPTEAARAEATLAEGGVVVFTAQPIEADKAKILGSRWSASGERTPLEPVLADASFVRVDPRLVTAQAVASPAALASLDVKPAVVGLHVAGTDISAREETNVVEAIGTVTADGGFYVERGYQEREGSVTALLVLGALGGVLMLGGTLTATFLALSDARPDLATLSAVGASPRKRRGVAMAYALVVSLVGAVLGAAVGFVPGVAVTRPLTTTSPSGVGQVGPFLDVPWLLVLSIVVALPLLTAGVVGLFTRSRLPMIARLD